MPRARRASLASAAGVTPAEAAVVVERGQDQLALDTIGVGAPGDAVLKHLRSLPRRHSGDVANESKAKKTSSMAKETSSKAKKSSSMAKKSSSKAKAPSKVSSGSQSEKEESRSVGNGNETRKSSTAATVAVKTIAAMI